MTNLYQDLKKHNQQMFNKNFLADLIKSKAKDFTQEQIKEIKAIKNDLLPIYNEDLLDALTKSRINESSVFWYDLLNLKTSELSVATSRVMSQLKDKSEMETPSNLLAYPLLEKLINDCQWSEENFARKFAQLAQLPQSVFLKTFQIFIDSQYFKNISEKSQASLINATITSHADFFCNSLFNKNNTLKKLLPLNLQNEILEPKNLITYLFPQITSQNAMTGLAPYYQLENQYNDGWITKIIHQFNVSEKDFKVSILYKNTLLKELIERAEETNSKQVIDSFIRTYNSIASKTGYEKFDLSQKEAFEKFKLEIKLMPLQTEKTRFKI